MSRVEAAVAAWESHESLVSATLSDAKPKGALPVLFRLSPEKGFDCEFSNEGFFCTDIHLAKELHCVAEIRPDAKVQSDNVILTGTSRSTVVQSAPPTAARNTSEGDCTMGAQSNETSSLPDCTPAMANVQGSRTYFVPDDKDDLWDDIYGRGLHVSAPRTLTSESYEESSGSSLGKEIGTQFPDRVISDSLRDFSQSTDSSVDTLYSFELNHLSQRNSSLETSESVGVSVGDAFENFGEIADLVESQSFTAPLSWGEPKQEDDVSEKHTSCPVSWSTLGVAAPRATFAKQSVPSCAVLGAETFLGSHVLQQLLLSRSHHIKALVTSAEAPEHFSHMTSDLLSVVLIGNLQLQPSRAALHDALCNVGTVVDCSDLDLSNVRTSQVADAVLESARVLVAAMEHPNSSVKRLIYCGNDLAVWDPRDSRLSGSNIEPDLGENDWFSIMEDDRKLSHAEAHGRTAAEIYLWTRASGDRGPYSMCAVISSLVLGPILSSSHAFHRGPQVRLGGEYQMETQHFGFLTSCLFTIPDRSPTQAWAILTLTSVLLAILYEIRRQLLTDLASSRAIPLLPAPFVDARDVAIVVSKLIDSHDSICGEQIQVPLPPFF